MSIILFGVLVCHTIIGRRPTERPLVLVRYTVVFVLILQYILALESLSSYLSPAPFPVELTTYVDKSLEPIKYGVYPNNKYHYFYVPFYFYLTSNTTLVDGVSEPTVNLSMLDYFAVYVSPEKLNGMWFDFVVTLLVVLYLNFCNFWLLNKNLKITESQKTKALLDEYASETQSKKPRKAIKLEILSEISYYRAFTAASRWLYCNFALVMICFTILVSILSRSLLSFGYFVFCMILIFNNR